MVEHEVEFPKPGNVRGTDGNVIQFWDSLCSHLVVRKVS